MAVQQEIIEIYLMLYILTLMVLCGCNRLMVIHPQLDIGMIYLMLCCMDR